MVVSCPLSSARPPVKKPSAAFAYHSLVVGVRSRKLVIPLGLKSARPHCDGRKLEIFLAFWAFAENLAILAICLKRPPYVAIPIATPPTPPVATPIPSIRAVSPAMSGSLAIALTKFHTFPAPCFIPMDVSSLQRIDCTI